MLESGRKYLTQLTLASISMEGAYGSGTLPPPLRHLLPRGMSIFFILTPPLKMTGNQTLKFLWAPFEKFVCIKGQNFVGISEKKNQQPLFKNPSSLQGQGKGSQERNCLKFIEHIGQIRRGLSCSSEIAQIIT